ncbi:heparinase II/III family protein [Formosa undariae]|uniref:Heparinase II/III family protein n=1 Tax=Formosa undariae TaxID=1325436 RepID=A0ABV5F3J4_9FLAO
MKLKYHVFIVFCFVLCSEFLFAQDSQHPRIYITNEAKSDFLQSIEQVDWKKELVEEKKANLEKYFGFCEKDPNWLVSRLQMNWNTKHDKVYLKGGDFSHSEGSAPVPTVRYSGTRDWATDYMSPKLEEVQPYLDDPKGLYLEHKTTHKKEWIHPSKAGFTIEKINEQIMRIAEDASFLYWLTGEKEYAELAAPIFLTYMDGMFYRDAPIDLNNTIQQKVSGLATFEVIHEGIVVSLVTTYDFLFDYFKSNHTSLDRTVAVFQKWGDQIITNGIPDNNWNLFQARFLTYIGLVLDTNTTYKNGKGKEYFLDHTFTTSTDRQLAIKESLLVYDYDTGIWPESPSYSVHVITTLLRIFTLLDHATNNNEFLNYPIIEKAALASFQYLFPNGYTIGFGDADHNILPPENFELLISNYQKYNETEKEALISGLLSNMISDDLYTRKAKDFFQLFFYVDELKTDHNIAEASLESLTSPTFYAPNVSLFNQRMGIGDDAMMVSTVGSYGNHAHSNGISIELYANNYVLGPDSGKGPSYWHPTFRNYYARMPAHNTVIVDGKSNYNNMRTYHPFQLDHSFPKSGETSNFNTVTYSKVSFVEPETGSDQQRFSALIKSNAGKSYMVDVFRSRKQEEGEQKHEYIYHNIGQTLDVFDGNNQALKFQTTEELSSKQGDLVGYDFFTDKLKTKTSGDARAIFSVKREGKPTQFTKLWVKGSKDQVIYKVKSPKSNALSEGTAPAELLDQPLPTLILKRQAAAWVNPFAVVFNPYVEGEINPIAQVTYTRFKGSPNTQVIDVVLNDKSTDRIVVNASTNDIATHNEFYQKGLLSIIRESEKSLDFMLLSGMTKFEKDGWNIIASAKPFTMSVERTAEGYVLQNNEPLTINMPYVKGKTSAELRLYKDGEIVDKRMGTKNRNNDNQLVFKLEKAYDKVVIYLMD